MLRMDGWMVVGDISGGAPSEIEHHYMYSGSRPLREALFICPKRFPHLT